MAKVRQRILELARDQGHITNKQARKVTKLPQVWFHLNALEKAGLLRHTDYNEWKPDRRRSIELVEL